MPQFSNYAESGILNFLLRSNTNNFGRPATIAIALCSNVPDEAHHGGTIPELANANGYARQNLGAPTDSVWTEVVQVATSGFMDNTGAITFGPATPGAWGWVSGIAILDSGVYGAGQVLMYGRLTTPKEVGVDDTFQFAIGSIDVYLG